MAFRSTLSLFLSFLLFTLFDENRPHQPSNLNFHSHAAHSRFPALPRGPRLCYRYGHSSRLPQRNQCVLFTSSHLNHSLTIPSSPSPTSARRSPSARRFAAKGTQVNTHVFNATVSDVKDIIGQFQTSDWQGLTQVAQSGPVRPSFSPTLPRPQLTALSFSLQENTRGSTRSVSYGPFVLVEELLAFKSSTQHQTQDFFLNNGPIAVSQDYSITNYQVSCFEAFQTAEGGRTERRGFAEGLTKAEEGLGSLLRCHSTFLYSKHPIHFLMCLC